MELNFTIGIIAVTGLVSWLAFSNEKLLQQLLLWPPTVTRGRQFHRFLTYGFVHGDFMHLLFNMFTLYFFGVYPCLYFGVAHPAVSAVRELFINGFLLGGRQGLFETGQPIAAFNLWMYAMNSAQI